MKLFFVSTLTLLTIFPAYPGKYRANGIDKVDKLRIEAGIELPLGAMWDDMAPLNIGANWKLASGVLNTKHFGRNGGIDYGFLYSLNNFYGEKYDSDTWREHVVWKDIDLHCNCYSFTPSFNRHRLVLRAGFHYQFLKKLDTHVGFFGGFAVVNPKVYGDYVVKAKAYIERSWGVRSGATWYFNHRFGIGLEWENDFSSYYGINKTGNNVYLKYHYLFSEKGKQEIAAKRKERKLKRLNRYQRELEEYFHDE